MDGLITTQSTVLRCQDGDEPHPRVFGLPDDYTHQMQDGFTNAVEKVLDRFSLMLHFAHDEAKGDAEHHQTQNVDPIDRARRWYRAA